MKHKYRIIRDYCAITDEFFYIVEVHRFFIGWDCIMHFNGCGSQFVFNTMEDAKNALIKHLETSKKINTHKPIVVDKFEM